MENSTSRRARASIRFWIGAAIAAAVVTIPACSVVTSFDGLAGGALTSNDASANDATAIDALTIDDAVTDSQNVVDTAPIGYFFDDFNRANNPVIGNGWIMKNPTAFEISADAVKNLLEESSDYQDDIVYRPSSEDLLDLLTEVDVTLGPKSDGTSCAQIHARIQASTVALAGDLDDYLAFLGCASDSLLIFRVNGGTYTTLASANVSPSLVAGQSVRISLQVTGSDTVSIVATLYNVNADGGTQVLASTSVTDSSSSRISSAGSVGFSESTGEPNGTYTYDNFVRIPQ